MKYLDFILGLISMLIVAFIFTKVKGWITNRVKNTIVTNSSIGNVFKKDGTEVFQVKKFFNGVFNIFDKTIWAKAITMFSRYFIIGSIVFGAVYGYGWWKGRGDTPIETNIAYDKEWRLNLLEHGEYIYKPKYSNELQLRDLRTDAVIKVFKGKDLGALQEKLKPISVQLKPVGILGYGVSSLDPSFEAGAGLSFLRYWKWNLEGFLTNKGAYVGTSYSITDNSALGTGVGKGWSGDERLIFYYRWKF